MKILVPKRYLSPGDIAVDRPVFFLAGPIRGGGGWQHSMCLALAAQDQCQDCFICCPCRWNGEHPLAKYFLPGREGGFPRQLNWERSYLAIAGISFHKPGCIVFWLPCESKEQPHPGPEPYAMDTRGELGEWRWRMRTEDARVVIGAEPAFPGLSQIQRNYSLALGYEFPIYPTLLDTAAAAAKLAYRT